MPIGDTSNYTPTAPISPAAQQAALMQLLGLEPEWSISKQTFQPLDAGWQRDQMRHVDDVLNTVADPLFMILSGQFDPSAFDPTIEEEVLDEGSDEGERMLRAVIERSDPNSVESFLAEAMLKDNMTGNQAVDAAIAKGVIQIPKVDGKEDRSAEERYRKWANEMYQMRLRDRPPVTATRAAPSPLMERARMLGIGDPRQQYTADMFATAQTDALTQRWNAAQEALRRANAEFLGARTEADRDPLIPAHRPSEGRRSPGQAAAARARDRRAREGAGNVVEDVPAFSIPVSIPGMGATRTISFGNAVQRNAAPAPSTPQRKGGSDRMRQASVNKARATSEYIRAAEKYLMDQGARRGVARALTTMGRTPAIDMLMARMGALPGLGR